MIACASAIFFSVSGPYPVSDDTISGGMLHSPTGFGSIDPPMIPNPSIKIVLNALRSMASDIALRMAGLSNGGFSRFTMRLVCVPVVIISQIAFGARAFTSFIRGTLTSDGKVMSKSPVAKASTREQHRQAGLRLAELECGLVIAIEGDVL